MPADRSRLRRRALIASCALATVAALLLVPRPSAQVDDADELRVRVLVYNHGYHTGIVVPVRVAGIDWSREFPCVLGSAAVEFSWGDSAFYTSDGFPLGTAFAALFFLSRASVVHVTGMDDPARPPETIRGIGVREVGSMQYAALAAHICRSLNRDSAGQPVRVHDGLFGPHSAFYASGLSYSFVRNCNTWCADGLHAAGCPAALWPALPPFVLRPL